MPALTTLHAASPLDADDQSRLAFTNDLTETLSRALDNVNSDFATMDDLTWTVQARRSGMPVDDTYALAIRIVNGATILAAAASGGTFVTISSNVTATSD